MKLKQWDVHLPSSMLASCPLRLSNSACPQQQQGILTLSPDPVIFAKLTVSPFMEAIFCWDPCLVVPTVVCTDTQSHLPLVSLSLFLSFLSPWTFLSYSHPFLFTFYLIIIFLSTCVWCIHL